MGTYSGTIFGWTLFPNLNVRIAHHTGVILSWNDNNPWRSIIAHYGANNEPLVRVETLKDAVIRADVDTVYINPHYQLQIDEPLYTIDDNGEIVPHDILIQYQDNHPIYNVISSNCQHFVKHLIGNIPIESDILISVPQICNSIVHTSIFGSEKDVLLSLHNVINKYTSHRDNGIAMWDRSLDLKVPRQKNEYQNH